jgi:hypothetical protein
VNVVIAVLLIASLRSFRGVVCADKDEAAFGYVTSRLNHTKELCAQRFQRGFVHVDMDRRNLFVVGDREIDDTHELALAES